MSKVLKSTPPQANRENQKIIGIKAIYTKQHQEVPEETQVDPQKLAEDILAQARREANQIISEATAQKEQFQAELNETRANWEVEKEQLSNHVKAAAYEEGFQQGMKKGFEEVEAFVQKANDMVTKANEDYHHHLRNSERTIVELAVKISEKVIGEKLADEQAFIAFAKQAIEQVKENKTAYIYVHPDHYESLIRIKQELRLILPAEAEIYIYANPDLTKTSCLIETPSGKLDASSEVQLSQIKTKLLEYLEEEKA